MWGLEVGTGKGASVFSLVRKAPARVKGPFAHDFYVPGSAEVWWEDWGSFG